MNAEEYGAAVMCWSGPAVPASRRVRHASKLLTSTVNPIQTLTRRELQVAIALCAVPDATLPEFARSWHSSINTVKTQVAQVYRKLGVSRRSQLVGLREVLRGEHDRRYALTRVPVSSGAAGGGWRRA